MDQTTSNPFSRSLRFRRERESRGVFATPIYRFVLQEPGTARELGVLTMQGNKVDFSSAAGAHEDFRIRKSHWNTKWVYEGGEKQEAARYGIGWNFRPYFKFRGEDKYFMRIKRRWPFSKTEPGEATQTVSFSRGDIPVMELKSFAPFPFFKSELRVPMEGEIHTNIDDLQLIAALLLFYQTHIEMRNRSAHAAST